MIKRVISALLAVLSVSALVLGLILSHQQRVLADKLIRLHVVANSDSEEDQRMKLRVRDAVLRCTDSVFDNKPENPKAALQAALPEIEMEANRCLRREGSLHRAEVTLKEELFPTREYINFSLPAGKYTALRVTIGDGRGQNWWCVVFPSLCMCASVEEFSDAAQTAGFTDGEVHLITENSDGYVLKFRLIEIFEKIREIFSGE